MDLSINNIYKNVTTFLNHPRLLAVLNHPQAKVAGVAAAAFALIAVAYVTIRHFTKPVKKEEVLPNPERALVPVRPELPPSLEQANRLQRKPANRSPIHLLRPSQPIKIQVNWAFMMNSPHALSNDLLAKIRPDLFRPLPQMEVREDNQNPNSDNRAMVVYNNNNQANQLSNVPTTRAFFNPIVRGMVGIFTNGFSWSIPQDNQTPNT